MLSRNPPLPVEVSDPNRLLASKEPIVAVDSESAVYLPPHPSLFSEISADSCRKRGISRMVSRLAWRNFPFESLPFESLLQRKRWDYVIALSLELDQSSGTETQ